MNRFNKKLFIITLFVVLVSSAQISFAQTFTANDISGDTGSSFGAAIADLNNDGFMDIYVANIGQNKLWIIIKTLFSVF